MSKTPQVKRFNVIGIVLLSQLCLSPLAAEEVKHEQPLPLEELRIFAEAYNRIKSTYVEEVDDQVLLKGAIAGMLDSLDPHSTYLDEAAYSNLQDSSAGQYGGLGIEVIPDNNAIKIITPIDDSPAKRAGILAGDRVVRINNTPLRHIKAEDAMELMRGEVGEKVHLSIRREGENKLLEFDLVREIIRLSSIRSEWLGKGIAYIRITQFQSRTGYDLTDAIEKLRDEHDQKITGLILDMRNNPGGVFNAAKLVSDAFLDKGLIVSTKGKSTSANTQYYATKGDVMYGAPIVALINSGTASAAEIVAAALQDHNRAIILGTPSFGKGSVQTLMKMSGNSALKLTTARYFTPSGNSIQGRGIIPDIQVEQAELVNSAEKDNDIYEADLKGSLANESNNKLNEELKIKSQIRGLLADDYQLSEAVNLLRGISILSLRTTDPVQKEQ